MNPNKWVEKRLADGARYGPFTVMRKIREEESREIFDSSLDGYEVACDCGGKRYVKRTELTGGTVICRKCLSIHKASKSNVGQNTAITALGETRYASEWAEMLGVSVTTVHNYRKKGRLKDKVAAYKEKNHKKDDNT